MTDARRSRSCSSAGAPTSTAPLPLTDQRSNVSARASPSRCRPGARRSARLGVAVRDEPGRHRGRTARAQRRVRRRVLPRAARGRARRRRRGARARRRPSAHRRADALRRRARRQRVARAVDDADVPRPRTELVGRHRRHDRLRLHRVPAVRVPRVRRRRRGAHVESRRHRAAHVVQRRAWRARASSSTGSPEPGDSSTTRSSTRTTARPSRWRPGATASIPSGGRCTRSASSSTATGCRRGDSTTTTVTGSSTRRSDSACRSCARTRASRSTRPRDRPDDVGPAAHAHPNVQFVIYHSGYELPDDDGEVEGPVHRDHRRRRREPPALHDARARPRPRRQRLGRARHHLVLPRPAARSRRARARQAARSSSARTT